MYGFSNFTFVELALSDIYFVAQDAKQEHKICYETTPHYYLLAFSKFCYKHASLEIIHFTPSMVQLLVHGAK
jgi:hypothetical protein